MPKHPEVTHPSSTTTGASSREHLDVLFGDRVSLVAPTKEFLFRFASAQQHVDYFSENYPPIVAALGQLDEESGVSLRKDLRELALRMNVATDADRLVLPLEYLGSLRPSVGDECWSSGTPGYLVTATDGDVTDLVALCVRSRSPVVDSAPAHGLRRWDPRHLQHDTTPRNVVGITTSGASGGRWTLCVATHGA
jgi:hypothetical protein